MLMNTTVSPKNPLEATADHTHINHSKFIKKLKTPFEDLA